MVIAKVKMEDFILKGLKKQLLLFWIIIIASLGYFLSVRIYLFPIMGWNIFWFALSLPLSFGYCYLIWYSTDYPNLYKEPNIKIDKPLLAEFQEAHKEQEFTEVYNFYILYQEKLEKINKLTGRYSNKESLIFGILPLFVGLPLVAMLSNSIKTISTSIVIQLAFSFSFVIFFLIVSLFVTKRIYFSSFCLKSYELSEKDIGNKYIDLLSSGNTTGYNYQKMYDHNLYLLSIEKEVERRHTLFGYVAVTPVVITILYAIFLR